MYGTSVGKLPLLSSLCRVQIWYQIRDGRDTQSVGECLATMVLIKHIADLLRIRYGKEGCCDQKYVL